MFILAAHYATNFDWLCNHHQCDVHHVIPNCLGLHPEDQALLKL